MSIAFTEGSFTDIELDMMTNEPPGLFPENQDSYWGTVRKVLADYLQAEIFDKLDQWYLNHDPRTVDADDIDEWEYMTGAPHMTAKSLADRRATVTSRMAYGAFTRTARDNIVKSYVAFGSTGPPTAFTPAGVPLTPAGVTLYPSASGSLSYTITENVEDFSYDVEITGPLGFLPDLAALARDLLRITPAGIRFTINSGTSAPSGTFGSGTFGSGTFGGG